MPAQVLRIRSAGLPVARPLLAEVSLQHGQAGVGLGVRGPGVGHHGAADQVFPVRFGATMVIKGRSIAWLVSEVADHDVMQRRDRLTEPQRMA